MAHLKKGPGGHLFKSPGGHLLNDCGVTNTCNSCSPPLPDTLYVTLTGVAGDFAIYSGTTGLPWRTFCLWNVRGSDCRYQGGPRFPRLAITWDVDDNCWYVRESYRRGCWKQWKGGVDPCDPTDSYTEHSDVCASSPAFACIRCDDVASCIDSAGATCVVSYEAP